MNIKVLLFNNKKKFLKQWLRKSHTKTNNQHGNSVTVNNPLLSSFSQEFSTSTVERSKSASNSSSLKTENTKKKKDLSRDEI